MADVLRVAGVGCALADFLYPLVDFSSPAFKRYLSRRPGDGGLVLGGLVFREDLEAFADKGLEAILGEITGGAEAASFNVGGPAIVALVIAAQLLHGQGVHVSYYGAMGRDEAGRRIRATLSCTPVDIRNYRTVDGPSPNTAVLSDPRHAGGHGERTFVHTIGAAWQFGPQDLDRAFFEADVRVFGATALVPRVHEALAALLVQGRQQGGLNVVHTVYDFLSEKRSPGARWPLGDGERTYPLVDLLVTDAEEARRISGARNVEAACKHFMAGGVHALAVTDGVEPVWFCSDGALFRSTPLSRLPVSERVKRERASPDAQAQGDTTGCGDNFVGGMLASIAAQKLSGRGDGDCDLSQAAAVGVCAGGCACFHAGGLYVETRPGEKAGIISGYYADYRRQVEPVCPLPEQML
jgi:sugar/nucleoside kinase (ribokinase family)